MTEASPEWILYVKTGCPWCIDAKQYLDDHGYAHTTVNVSQSREGFEEMREISGQAKAPTLKIGDDLVLPDFGVDELEDFLSEHGLDR